MKCEFLQRLFIYYSVVHDQVFVTDKRNVVYFCSERNEIYFTRSRLPSTYKFVGEL